jgi:hypothetical protein
MAGLVEHDDAHVADGPPKRFGDLGDDRLGRVGEVRGVARGRRQHELLHVERGAGRPQRAPWRYRDRRQRSRESARAQVGALERIDGDVERQASGRTCALAVGEHRRAVLRALAGHDGAAPRRRSEHGTHRGRGRGVRPVRVAPTGPPRRRHGGGAGGRDGVPHEPAVQAGGGLRDRNWRDAGQ